MRWLTWCLHCHLSHIEPKSASGRYTTSKFRYKFIQSFLSYGPIKTSEFRLSLSPHVQVWSETLHRCVLTAKRDHGLTDRRTRCVLPHISTSLPVSVLRWLCSESARSCKSSGAGDSAHRRTLCPLQQCNHHAVQVAEKNPRNVSVNSLSKQAASIFEKWQTQNIHRKSMPRIDDWSIYKIAKNEKKRCVDTHI